MQNLTSFNLNKQLNQQQQQLFQTQQQQNYSNQQIVESSAIDYSLNRANLLAFQNQTNNNNNTPLNLSQSIQQQQQQNQYQQYQQKKLNYKTKIKTEHDYRHDDSSNKFNNEDKDIEDDDYNDDSTNYEMNPNLDSSFSNYSYSTEQSTDLLAKNNSSQLKKPRSSNSLQTNKLLNNLPIKQELQDVNDYSKKKRRESYADIQQQQQQQQQHHHQQHNSNYINDDDDHNSEMNDDDEDHTSQMNDSKEKRPKSDLNCVVCDSPANGYNFDAVTCESCKAFFRRNAFRPINLFRCSNNDSCVITVATRKKCKKCRIAKCFRLGMRRDWIMTEVEREEKRKKIEENRRRKQSTGGTSADLDAFNQQDCPSSNMSNQYDELSNQHDSCSGSSLPVRRRRRRRRNSWFDINNKKPAPQQQPQTVNNNNSINNNIKSNPNEPIHNNLFNKQSSNVTVNTEKQNSPLSSSLSSSSSSSSSSLNRNRFNEPTNMSLNEINENMTHQQQQEEQQSFNLHNSTSTNILPLNLITKQSLDATNLSLSNKLALNQFVVENNSKSLTNPTNNAISAAAAAAAASSFVLSPTVQHQLQLTFEQQRLLKNNLDFNTHHHSNPSTTNDALLKHHQYAAVAAAAAMAASSVQLQQQTASSNSAFNLSSSTSNLHIPLADTDNDVVSIDDKKFDPRRRRKLKDTSLDDNSINLLNSNKLTMNPLQHHSTPDMLSNFQIENKLNPFMSLSNSGTLPSTHMVNTLLPSLKYLSKSNIGHLNEIKLNNNNKNESSYISFSNIEQTDLVRSPRVLSPVSSTSSSSSSSSLSSCDQYPYSSTNPNENVSIKMTEIQRKQVEAIQQAYKQAIQLVKAQGLPKNSQDINTTINLTELAVRRVIFYFKLISDFRELKHDLMVVLLKFNMMSLLQIHGINSYNKEENTFKEPDTDDTPFSAQSIESVYGTSVYELSISITRNLFDLCAGDMTHIKILMLIVLFDPYNDKLSDQEKHTVAKLQNKYVTLLHAYLCEILGSPKAEHTFKSILIEISKINDLGKWFEKTVAEKSSCDFVRPLMKEVFGIATPANSAASTPIASSQPSSIGSSCSTKSVKLNDAMEFNQNDSNYETPATCSTSLSDSSFYKSNININTNNNQNNITTNSKYVSSSPNNIKQ